MCGGSAVAAATAIVWVVEVPGAATVRSTRLPGLRSIEKTYGCERPRSEIVATIRWSSSQAGPWRPRPSSR